MAVQAGDKLLRRALMKKMWVEKADTSGERLASASSPNWMGGGRLARLVCRLGGRELRDQALHIIGEITNIIGHVIGLGRAQNFARKAVN